MRLRSSSDNDNSAVHLVNADTRSLPCMLCPATNMERFPNMRILLEHFTNEHMAIHLYGCHLCNQASTYPDFLMHSCFEGKEEFITGEPKFSHCFALLLCADCGIQFSLNGGVVNDQAVHEYLSLMAVHNSTSMRLVCIYSMGQLKKDQNHFCTPYTSRMAKIGFLCKSDTDLQKCCPKLCPRYFCSDNVGLATFARTTKQFECLELININPRIKNVSIEDVLSPVLRTESKIRSIMADVLHPSRIKKSGLPNSFTNSLHADENNILSVDGRQELKHFVKLNVFSYDTCIPRDIMQGFLFEKDIHECGGCYNTFDHLDTLKDHYQHCQKGKMLPADFDPVNPRCSRLVFNYNSHPSSRITCAKCPKTSFCSFVGLRLHYARDHSIFVNDDHTRLSNKKTVLTYGWEVVTNELKHPTIVPTEQGPRLSISNIDNLLQVKIDTSTDSVRQSKKRRASRTSNAELKDESMEFEFERDSLKRAAAVPLRTPFTRFEHKRRLGSVSLEEAISSARSTTERSMTPANSQAETTRRRTNALEVDSDSHSKRDPRSSSHSVRTRVSHSPTAAEDHNSSTGSVDNSQRKRPPSERAKRMEQKKLERERRENEDAEKEEHEREIRRRRRTKQLEDEAAEANAAAVSTSTSETPKPTVNVIISEVQVLKTINGAPTKQIQQVEEPAEDVEIIDLSDDSQNEPNEEQKALDKIVAGQPVHPEESFLFCCFFCGQDIRNTTDFIQHMARHSEQIQRCPLCLVFSRKEQQFKHVLHVIDHIIERHIRMDNNHCVCPHCRLDFGPIQDLEPLYMCFQHVLFMCEKSDYCMLCLGTNKVTRFKNNENKWEHRHECHTVVYNRFICSKCMGGFPSKFALLDHTCDFTPRCICNQVQPFPTKQAFAEHVRNSADKNAHSLVRPLNGPLGIYFPSSYRKQLKAMEIEALKQSRLICPERNECLMFFNKYPHLVVPFKTLSSRIKTLRIIKDFSKDDHMNLSQADFPPVLPKNRKRITGDEKAEHFGGGQKQVRRIKRKQQANPEEQAVKKFKYEQATSDRSNVWKLVEKYGDDKTMTEVADVLEDLILSVSDPAVNYANGMIKSTKRFAGYSAPRYFPTAQDLIMLPLLPSQPPVLFREVQEGPELDDASLADTPPPFLYSIREKQPDIMASSPQTPPVEDEEDDEIEVIGEIKGQPTTYMPIVQPHQRKVVYVRQGRRIVNVDSDAPNLLQERSYSPMLMTSQKTQKSTVPDWLSYTD